MGRFSSPLHLQRLNNSHHLWIIRLKSDRFSFPSATSLPLYALQVAKYTSKMIKLFYKYRFGVKFFFIFKVYCYNSFVTADKQLYKIVE